MACGKDSVCRVAKKDIWAMKKFSIVIPCYNVRPYIERCLASIDCSCDDFEVEVLCVNDGSSDGTEIFLDGIVGRNNLPYELRVIHQANAGVSAARNKGIELATGDYICFADADDAMVKGAILYLSKIVDKTPDADLVYFGSYYCNDVDNGKTICEEKQTTVYDIVDSNRAQEAFQCCVGRLMAWNGCFKRTLAERIRFKPYPNGEDTLWGMECFCHAKKVIVTTAKLYQYVDNRAGSAVHAKNLRHLNSALSVVREQCEVLNHWEYKAHVASTFYAKKMRSTIVGNMWSLVESLGDEGWGAFKDYVRGYLRDYPGYFSSMQKFALGFGVKSKWIFYLMNRLPFEVYVKWRAYR